MSSVSGLGMSTPGPTAIIRSRQCADPVRYCNGILKHRQLVNLAVSGSPQGDVASPTTLPSLTCRASACAKAHPGRQERSSDQHHIFPAALYQTCACGAARWFAKSISPCMSCLHPYYSPPLHRREAIQAPAVSCMQLLFSGCTWQQGVWIANVVLLPEGLLQQAHLIQSNCPQAHAVSASGTHATPAEPGLALRSLQGALLMEFYDPQATLQLLRKPCQRLSQNMGPCRAMRDDGNTSSTVWSKAAASASDVILQAEYNI